MKFKFPTFLVGGAVRDKLICRSHLESKDLDFVVLAPSFADMEAMLIEQGCKIFQSRPEFLVSRANHPEFGAVDFAVARTDSDAGDGRRPDSVDITADLTQDLSRRDFTMNAIAENVETGELIDPFFGQKHLAQGLIVSVRDPRERLKEDKLRAFRAIRFAVTKRFEIDPALRWAITNLQEEDFASVSDNRIFDELGKMFKHDTIRSMEILQEFPRLTELAFRSRSLWLAPSLKKRD